MAMKIIFSKKQKNKQFRKLLSLNTKILIDNDFHYQYTAHHR